MVAATVVSNPNGVDPSYGHTDQKAHQNLMAMTAENNVKALKVYEATVDAASISDGGGQTVQLTGCTGVALGDAVIGVSFGVDLVDMSVSAYVQATDVIEVRIQNESGSATDLASTTVRVVVAKLTE